MKARKELTKALTKRYEKAPRKTKSMILTEFCATTGYNRDYAASLLRKALLALTKSTRIPPPRSGRAALYDSSIVHILDFIWKKFDHLCAKRLVVLMRTILPQLKRNRFLAITPEQYKRLESISAATVDRLLGPSHKANPLRGHCYTRPSNSLKESIPIRTFGDWQDVSPGHFQIDTVGHDGGFIDSNCSFSLCLTDVCLGWTERYAMANKAFKWVKEGLIIVKRNIPFNILHLHPDNGSEFINYGLVAWCKEQSPVIDLSRSRAGKKNDNCHVEQKNFDTIRKLIGYARYATPEMIDTLNRLYAVHGLLLNYFYPSQKLLSKTREGSKVKKVYDKPQSPAQRLLNHPEIPNAVKVAVAAKRRTLDPIQLSAEVDNLADLLLSQLAMQGNLVIKQAGTD